MNYAVPALARARPVDVWLDLHLARFDIDLEQPGIARYFDLWPTIHRR